MYRCSSLSISFRWIPNFYMARKGSSNPTQKAPCLGPSPALKDSQSGVRRVGQGSKKTGHQGLPCGALAPAEAAGPTAGTRSREPHREAPGKGHRHCASGALEDQGWREDQGASRAHRAGTGPGRVAAPHSAHSPTHLFQGVRGSFNDLREMFIVLSDDVLHHVYGRGTRGEGTRAEQGLQGCGPRPAVLKAAGRHHPAEREPPAAARRVRTQKQSEARAAGAGGGARGPTRALDGDLLVVLDHEVLHQLVRLQEGRVGRSRPG